MAVLLPSTVPCQSSSLPLTARCTPLTSPRVCLLHSLCLSLALCVSLSRPLSLALPSSLYLFLRVSLCFSTSLSLALSLNISLHLLLSLSVLSVSLLSLVMLPFSIFLSLLLRYGARLIAYALSRDVGACRICVYWQAKHAHGIRLPTFTYVRAHMHAHEPRTHTHSHLHTPHSPCQV